MKLSILFQKAAPLLFFLALIISVLYFLRGHQAPGGGFIAGLFSVGAFWVWSLAFGSEKMLEKLILDPRTIMALGLLVGILSAVIGLAQGQSFFQSAWPSTSNNFLNSFGTPVLFDLGVFLVVLGLGTFWISTLSKQDHS